jgi:hypothetical protein
MKLVDLEQQIFVPVVDETHGGVTVEMKMTVGEFFAKCCQGFEPEVVDAIPVEWLAQNARIEDGWGNIPFSEYIKLLIWEWHQQEDDEQGAR